MHATEVQKTGVGTCKRKRKREEVIFRGDPKNLWEVALSLDKKKIFLM